MPPHLDVPFYLKPSDMNIIIGSFTIVGTAASLFFTITLIPFQQLGAQFSSSTLKYIRRDPSFIFSFFIFLLLMLGEAALLLISPVFWTITLSVSGVIFSILILGWLWNKCMTMLNPKEFIIPKICEAGCKAVSRLQKKLSKWEKTPGERVAELELLMQEVLGTTQQIDPKEELIEIPRKLLGEIHDELLRLKELAIQFIKTSQVEMFSACLAAVETIIEKYWTIRKRYISKIDYLLLDLADDLIDIVAISNTSSNLQFSRAMWKSIKRMAIRCLDSDCIGSKDGWHFISAPLTDIMTKTIPKDILTGKLDSAYEGCRILGEIGVAMGRCSYDKSAAEIVKLLTNFSMLGHKSNQIAISQITRQQIAEIFYFSLAFRKLSSHSNYPYDNIIKNYEKLMSLDESSLLFSVSSDPIAWWETDLLKDRSLSNIVCVALFPDIENHLIVQENLKIVSNILKLLFAFYHKTSTLQSSFNSQLYQIALWLLAFMNPQTALEFLVYRQSVCLPNDKNKNQATEILFDLLEWFFQVYFNATTDKSSRVFGKSEILNNLLSTYYLLLHFQNKGEMNILEPLKDLMLSQIQQVKEKAQKGAINISDIEWVNLSFFSGYIKQISGFKRIHRLLAKMLNFAGLRYINNYEMDLLDHIKRPIGTFRADVFEKFDEEIFSKEIRLAPFPEAPGSG